jgi:aBig family protein/concanavalin A-like lectin/glucanase superfamily protein
MITSTLAALSLAFAPATDGLVAHYPLAQTAGTAVTDASGNGRDATVQGGATWRGSEGLQLGGSDGYVKLPDNLLRGLSAVSVSIQVKIDSDQAAPYFIWGIGNTVSGAGNGYLFTTGNAYRTSIATGNFSTEKTVTKGSNLARGVWKTLTYTLADNTGVLYEDGVEVARSTTITALPPAIGNGTTTADYIGRSMYTSDRYLKGSVRDFRVYDHALTAAEVNALGGISDADRVARDAAALSVADTATSDLTLPVSGPNGAAISWASNSPAVISPAGKVVRPAAGQPDASVVLTATVSRGFATQMRTFTVNVPAMPSDAVLAQQAAADLNVWDADDVRGNLTLSTTGSNGASVSWVSSDPAVVAVTGEVTRGAAAMAVTLTATVRVGEATAQRTFALTVRAKAVREPYAGYAFSYFTGEGTANGEQIYFAASRGNDALRWDELNAGQPALTSTFGDRGCATRSSSARPRATSSS